MKLLSTILLLLGVTLAQGQQSPQQVLEKLLPEYLQSLSADIRLLGQESDSAKWSDTQSKILSTYFLKDSVRVPNLLVSDEVYHKNRTETTIRSFIESLPYYYWKGFQFSMHDTAAVVKEVHIDGGKLTAILLVPVSLRGISRADRKAQRISERMEITLEGQWINHTLRDCKISAFSTTGESLLGDPFTQKKAQEIERELLNALRQILSLVSPDSLRHKACQQLRSRLKKDTIFLVGTDKVTTPYSINECKLPDKAMMGGSERLTIAEFSLDYTTDFYRGANQVYIGQRTSLKKVRPGMDVGEWYQTSKKDWVPVEESVANSRLYDWKVSDLIIHF